MLFEGVRFGETEKLERVAQAVMWSQRDYPGALRAAYPNLIHDELPASELLDNPGVHPDPRAKAFINKVVESAIKGEPPKEPQIGFAIETRTQEEADLVAAMRAQGKSGSEIQEALDTLRASKGKGATDQRATLIARLKAADGDIDLSVLSKLLHTFEPLKDGSLNGLRSFAARRLGLASDAITIRNVAEDAADAVGAKGISGAPVYLVQDTQGRLLGVVKRFPKTQLPRMAGELYAMDRLGRLRLRQPHATRPQAQAAGGGCLCRCCREHRRFDEHEQGLLAEIQRRL